jgi:hypothetical protein
MREHHPNVMEFIDDLPKKLEEKLPDHDHKYRAGYVVAAFNLLRMEVELEPIRELQTHMVPSADDDALPPPQAPLS